MINTQAEPLLGMAHWTAGGHMADDRQFCDTAAAAVRLVRTRMGTGRTARFYAFPAIRQGDVAGSRVPATPLAVTSGRSSPRPRVPTTCRPPRPPGRRRRG